MATIPTTPKGRRTHTEILAAARRVFARDGFVAARMQDVAAEADLSMGGLYRYFKNKEDLFAELIEGLHEELYTSSRAREHPFGDEPYLALREANEGYLQHYFDNRDVMRAFMEAAHVDSRFRDIWWEMRRRHTDRFVAALEERFGVKEVGGVPVAVAADAMACMVEQAAYVWFAQEALQHAQVDVGTATDTTTRVWYRTFFDPRDGSIDDAGAQSAASDDT